LTRYMPELEAHFHYRVIDVSSIKELARRWRPELLSGVRKKGEHLALADIRESIDELRYYRDNFFRAGGGAG
ncbi:MAG: exonuclease domain-containing protein, partial [Gammaproteobacteria bacterium]|nr:exonuclease domain-containing protein [Gammaproteobacteria bacterium]